MFGRCSNRSSRNCCDRNRPRESPVQTTALHSPGDGQRGHDGFMVAGKIRFRSQDLKPGLAQRASVYEGLTRYTREWFFEPGGRLRLVEKIPVRQARVFKWMIHTHRIHPITSRGNTRLAHLGGRVLHNALDGFRGPHAPCLGVSQRPGQPRLPSPRVRDRQSRARGRGGVRASVK